jgi:hypothetical protein
MAATCDVLGADRPSRWPPELLTTRDPATTQA